MATNSSSNVSRKSVQKLTIGPSKPVTARNSLVGHIIVGDYIDPMNQQRTLMLERVAKSSPEKASTPPTARAASRAAATAPATEEVHTVGAR